jgi:hypothetical protein
LHDPARAGDAIWLIRQPLEGPAPSSEHQIKEIARAISSMADRSRWSHSTGEEEQFEVRIIQANHTSTRLRLTILQAKVGVGGKAKDTSSYNLIWRTREAESRGKQGEEREGRKGEGWAGMEGEAGQRKSER